MYTIEFGTEKKKKLFTQKTCKALAKLKYADKCKQVKIKSVILYISFK